jgi:hypothetical protein
MSTPSLELPVLTTPTTASERQQAPLAPAERDRLISRPKALSWLSLAYMTVEGAVAITAAALAGSVALLGFGLDSAIEGLASIIVIWRFTGSRRLSDHAEQRAQRLVAVTFFLLAPYIAHDRFHDLGAVRADDSYGDIPFVRLQLDQHEPPFSLPVVNTSRWDLHLATDESQGVGQNISGGVIGRGPVAQGLRSPSVSSVRRAGLVSARFLPVFA